MGIKLPLVESNSNTTVNISTRKTPYKLVFGVYPRLPVDITLGSD